MKDKVVKVRMNEELYNTLLIKSNSANMNMSEYIRKSINESDIKADNSKDILSVINAVNKIGNNINQIAHNLNIANKANKLDDIDYDNILDVLIIIEKHLSDLLKEI